MFDEHIREFSIPHYNCKNSDTSFVVANPSMINNKYVAYEIMGIDNLGAFDGKRRYNHFSQIRTVLVNNWPGVYVPGIPGKQLVGNKDVKFILERRYFLERFFK
mmetsp:Transcript_78684/g.109002  ORF Transcript_78684/g.109002 Transcript_78684/m.109002 type:complete len:104 (+) Transcript_78684:402-713(+)